MRNSLTSVFGLTLVILLIGSCSLDDNSSISSERGQQLVGSAVDAQQAAEASLHPAGYLFYVDAYGIILSSVPLQSMTGVMEALSEDNVSAFDRKGILEIRDRSIIEKVLSIAGVGDANISLSDVDIVGLMTFDQCVLECCGSPDCSWGRLKYCLAKCMEDHDPKEE